MHLFTRCPIALTPAHHGLWTAALLAISSTLAAPAAAQPSAPQLSASFDACMNQSGGVTVEMHACISAEHAHQDQQLNRSYQALMAELTPERKKQLQTAQRLWLQYRDANCQFYADPDGGTAAGVAAAECVLQMTAERARELKHLAWP